MGRLELTLACGDYDRTRAIRTGEVKPDGVELNVVTLAPEEMFYRMARFREFDVSELSLSTYTVLRGRGEPLVAVPVFPSFSFRHSSVFVATHAGIKEPRDLVGKRMGVPNRPAYLVDTAELVAELRGISLEQLADQERANAITLFQKMK